MSMRVPSNIDTDLNSIATLASQAGPITSPLSPTTQSNIRDILRQEQDHLISLLSLNPLVANLLISYANRAALLESAPATPSVNSEEWKALRNTLIALREENDSLKSEARGMVRKLETAEAPRDQISFFEQAKTTQEDEIRSLQAELVEVEDKYDQLMMDSNLEMATLRMQVLDLEAQRGDLRETVVEQQMKISKLERRYLNSPPTSLRPLRTINPTTMREREWVIENVGSDGCGRD